MNATEYLLQTLTEELAETIQCISKIQRFGPDDVWPRPGGMTNMQKLKMEINDILGTLEMCEERRIIRCVRSRKLIDSKKSKIRKWMRYSRSLNRLR